MCSSVTTTIEHQHARSAFLLTLRQYFLDCKLAQTQLSFSWVSVSEDVVKFDHFIELFKLIQVLLRRYVCELIATWKLS